MTVFCVTSLKSPAENAMASQLEQIVAVGKRQLFKTFKERFIFTLRERVDIKRAVGKIHSIPVFVCTVFVFVCTKLCFPCVSVLSLFLFNFGGKVLK